jgi:hypothetical protein
LIPLKQIGDPQERALLEQADELRRRDYSEGLSRADADLINRKYGVDFTTALLYAHFFAKLKADLFSDAEPQQRSAPTPPIVIVPGAFHKEYPELGSDGRRVADMAVEREWPCESIPLQSLGTNEANAKRILSWFDDCRAPEVVVVAVSKGAADLRTALAARPELWRRLRGVICISSILCGTPIANWLLDRWGLWLTTTYVLWYWNLERSSLVELRCSDAIRGVPAQLSPPFTRPSRTHNEEQLFVDPIQIVGFPLRKHLASWRSRLWHRRFRRFGPSDGVIWLAELLEQPSTVVPVWGVDHYMRTSAEVYRMLWKVIELLAAPRDTLNGESSEVAP